jgi:hypothetical protein
MSFTPISTVKDRFEELAKTRDEFDAVELVAREFHLSHERVARLVVGQKSEALANAN